MSDQSMSGHRPAAQGNQPLRSGGLQHLSFRVFGEMGHDPTLDANPPTVMNGVRLLQFTQCEWAILMPATVTSYRVTFYRLAGRVQMVGDTEVVVVPLTWVRDETESATESMTYLQDVRGDELVCVIHDVGGAVGVGFTILYKGVNQ